MKKIKIRNILAYAEGDATGVLKYAADVAAKMGARLTIVDVLEASHMSILMSASAALASLVRDAKRDRLAKLAAQLSASGSKIRHELLEGHAETAIIRAVLKDDHNLLMIGSTGEAARSLTATGMRLMRQCPCPVWVARPGHSRRRLRVLAAVDALPGDVPRGKLNAKVLALADAIANLCGGELHALNAWHAYGERLLRGHRFGGHRGEVDSYVHRTLTGHTEELAALLERTGTVPPGKRVHLLKGDAGEIIPRFCKEQKVDILVLGTIARTGLGAALIGNTAETVVSKVECSILAVKPDGFVCPVLPERVQDAHAS